MKAGKSSKKLINTQFHDVIVDYILPLFPGSVIDETCGYAPTTGRKFCSILKGNTSLAIRKELSEEPFVIKRKQIFTAEDSEIVNSFVKNFHNFQKTKKLSVLYKSSIVERCLEVSILNFLSKAYPKILFHVMNVISYWQNRTYEGNKVALSIKILRQNLANNSGNKLNNHEKIYEEDFFASLTNGLDDCIVIDQNLDVLRYEKFKEFSSQQSFAPVRFSNLCGASKDSVIIALTRSNEILCFDNTKLKFAKRSNRWTIYQHETIIKQLSGGSRKLSEAIRNSIYQTAIDVSYTKTGGLIACVDKNNVKNAEGIFQDDCLKTSPKKRISIFKKIIDERKFQDLPRLLREEIVAIDGATIIDSEGTILAIGAIVKLNGGSSSGGRKAATVALSKYGTAVKISNDSYIEGFREKKLLFKI